MFIVACLGRTSIRDWSRVLLPSIVLPNKSVGEIPHPEDPCGGPWTIERIFLLSVAAQKCKPVSALIDEL